MNRARRCSGREVHLIKDQTCALKTHLSESIARVITAEIARDWWTHQHIAIVGSTSNG